MSKIEKTEEMFCYQCEQRAGCSGCTGARGVCGKSSKTALLQDKLTGSMVALAEAVGEQNVSEKTNRIMIEGLFATLTNVNFDDEALEKLIETAVKEKEVYASGCSVCQAPCGRMEIYEMEKVWREPDEDIKSLKSLLLFGLRGIAAYAYHAMVLGYNDEEVNRFFYKGMSALGQDRTMENLLSIVMETGAVNFKCMELLDKANTETYGIPAPAEVSLKVEKGPFIVFFFSAFSCLATLPVLLFDYTPMSLKQLLFLIMAGVCASGGQFGITAAYANAPASEISIYDYTIVIFAGIWSFLLWDDIPDLLSVIGYIVIFGSSLAMFFYNRSRAS